MSNSSLVDVLAAHLKARGLVLVGPAGDLDVFAQTLALREIAEVVNDANSVPLPIEGETTQPIPRKALNKILKECVA